MILDGLLIFTLCLGAVCLMIVIHELGHYFAGMIAGIPAKSMKIQLFHFLQHIAIKNGERWISPMQYDEYVETTIPYLKTRPKAYFYTAGGLMIQTVCFVATISILRHTSTPKQLVIPIAVALFALLISYFIMDMFGTRRTMKPRGDFSALWKISPAATAILTGLIICTHLYVLSLTWG